MASDQGLHFLLIEYSKKNQYEWKIKPDTHKPGNGLVLLICLGKSKAMLLLWILFVIDYSCSSCFLVCSLQPSGHLLGNDQPLGSLVHVSFSCVFLSLSYVVSWVRHGIWLYRFLILTYLTLNTPAKITSAFVVCCKFLLTLFDKVKYRDKQCGPRSDYPYRSSLIWLYIVCWKSFKNISADDKSRRLLLWLAF